MLSITELKSQIREARISGNIARETSLRHELRLQEQRKYEMELAGIVRLVADRLFVLASENTSRQEIVAAIESLHFRTLRWFADRLRYEAESSQAESIAAFINQANPTQLRAALGLPVDDTGALKPRPENIGDITDDGLSLREILVYASPLLMLRGLRLESKRTPPADLLLVQIRSQRNPQAIVERDRPSVSSHWRSRLQFHLDRMQQRILTAIDSRDQTIERLQLTLRQWFNRFIGIPLGLNRQAPGYTSEVTRELRQERLRVAESGQKDVIDLVSGDVSVGFELNSRFLETTRPEHAANDGKRFYKDNRPGSADTWENRIIPPYAPNCVCFTIPIFDTPEGDEYTAEFGLRISRDEIISIRDVGTFQQWFDRQRQGIQRKIIGADKWDAVPGQQTSYADYFHQDGKPLSASELLAESPAERERRRARTQIVFDAQRRRHFDSWESPAYLNKYSSDPSLEAEYRRRLDEYLRRILK